MNQSALSTSIAPHHSPGMKYKRPLMLALGGLVLLLQACATAPTAPPPNQQAQDEAKAAYLAHDYQRTLAIVEPLAVSGEPWAQYTLGYMYHYGRGVTMDKKMAKQWIQRAAEQGYLPAQQAMQRLAASAPPRSNEEDALGTAKPAVTPPAAETGKPTPPSAPPPAMSKPGEPAPVLAMPDKTQATVAPVTPPAPTTPSAPAIATPTATAPATPPMTMTPPKAAAIPMTPATTTAANKTNGIKDRAWISAQDPQHYTLQLVAASNEAAIIRFIHKHGLEKEAAYYSISRNGKPWYTVIYGSYASREEARQALRKLPASLGKSSPWIRSFNAVRKQIGP